MVASDFVICILVVQCFSVIYKRFNTGEGEIVLCVGCQQLPFPGTLLVVTWYRYILIRHLFCIVFEEKKGVE